MADADSESLITYTCV